MERRLIFIRGIVQGVGFRPFVFNLASQLSLTGFVRNDDGTVAIEVEGESGALDRFATELSEHPPALARIESISSASVQLKGEREFRIETSRAGESGAQRSVFISPDVATCDDCLRELFDPKDRRYRYPFINCTNCGPRLTIVTGAPYDRPRTTMALFAMCRQCQAEYDDPRDRRFHAQPTCCPRCGPQLELLDAQGKTVASDDPVRTTADALRAGGIVAIKGLGGFHLACSALDDQVVRALRERKHRDEKPFAIMVSNVAAARVLCEVGPAEAGLLRSPSAPIVLLARKSLQHLLSADVDGDGDLKDGPTLANFQITLTPTLSRGTGRGGNETESKGGQFVADAVAPGNPSLGVMVPYTPLHHLLFDGTGGLPLVMTSGNRSDEPIAYENDDAVARLSGIADLFLVHNRPIQVRCDDSVTRVVVGLEASTSPSPGTPGEGRGGGLTRADAQPPNSAPTILSRITTIERSSDSGHGFEALGGAAERSAASALRSELPIRRSRGYAPQPIAMPLVCRLPMLAVGGQLKGTVALGRDRHAFVSHHLGDLDHYEAFKAFERDIALYEQLFDVKPRQIVHDLHPDYASTGYAMRRGAAENVRLIGVQHHHAHMASCMAENRLGGPVIGVSFDGTGYGLDGAVWGGEFLIGDYRTFERAAHLRYVRMPGADTAIREPWRMALAHLLDAECGDAVLRDRISENMLKTARQMILRGFNSPLTSSMGRLFDAVAALAGVRDRVSYEGQAAIELEWLCARFDGGWHLPF